MNKPDDIPQDVWDASFQALDSAWAEHDEVFNPASNSISQGLFDRFIEATARAIMAAKAEEREACIKTVYDCADYAHEEGDVWLKNEIAAAIRKRSTES